MKFSIRNKKKNTYNTLQNTCFNCAYSSPIQINPRIHSPRLGRFVAEGRCEPNDRPVEVLYRVQRYIIECGLFSTWLGIFRYDTAGPD